MAHSQSVEWVFLNPDVEHPVQVGDMLSADAGGMPIYRVVALAGRQVWLGDERRPSVRIMPLDGFRWRGGPAADYASA